MASASSTIIGAILAGGAGTRLGGAGKATLKLAGGTLLGHVRHRLAPQCADVVLCVAARHIDAPWARASGLPVAVDAVAEAGPLAGVAAALDWTARTHPGATHVLTAPVDCPFLPGDLAARLAAARDTASIIVAASNGRRHHAAALWPVSLADELAAAVENGQRRIGDWQEARGAAEIAWDATPHDPFFNINTPDDLASARTMAEHPAFAP